MYAIINCCDRFHIFAYHTILTYQILWEDNPFIFRVPYNDIYPKYIKDKFGDKVELIKSKKPFLDTILSLTKDIDKNEMIYWCSSDTYIDKIHNIEKLKKLHNFMLDCPDNISGGISTKFKGINKGEYYKKYDDIDLFYRTKMVNAKNINIWLHQYLRVDILQNIFKCLEEPKNQVKELDYQLYKDTCPIYNYLSKYNFLCLDKSYIRYGENTSRNKITLNCIESLKKYKIDLPNNFETINKNLYWG